MNIILNKETQVNQSHLAMIQDNSHKYLIVYGGSGSGKSYAIAQKLIIKAVNAPRKILVIRKTLTSHKDTCWALLKSVLSKWQLRDRVIVNKTDYTITFPHNGSQFILKGCDDPERLKSLVDVTDVWCEECTELSEDDYEQITLRIRANVEDSQVICSFNPVSKTNWVYKRWFQPGVTIAPDTIIYKSTYKDNKFLPQHYINTLENLIRTNPVYYRIYSQGEFCSLDKLVYNNWKVEKFELDAVKDYIHIVGMDFGYVTDPSTIVDSYVDDNNKIIYVYRIWGATGKTNDELAKVLVAMGLSKSHIIADSAEQKSISELKKSGILRIRASMKGPDSVVYGIKKLQQYSIIVHPSCEGLITELENYSWEKDKKTGEYLEQPIDSFNHYCDALRYSMQIIGRPSAGGFDRKLLGV